MPILASHHFIEQGSDFHLFDNYELGEPATCPWDGASVFVGTGRDALKSILKLGMKSQKWKRLWVPSYFCQTVVRSILETGIAVDCYNSWRPGVMGSNDGPCTIGGDVVLVVNHFGLSSKSNMNLAQGSPAAIIEDHTHDPWSGWAHKSRADYCISSLRKVLPIPDGAVLWSPLNLDLPACPKLDEAHRLAVERKLESMKLKQRYLQGELANKSAYLALAKSGEGAFSRGEVSAISPWSAERIGSFPVAKWRNVRKLNHRALCQGICSLSGIRVLRAPQSSDTVPFSCILIFDSAKRTEYLRTELIRARIYPAILWPMDDPATRGVSQEDVDTSRRMLSLHCDMRYSQSDMAYLGETIRTLNDTFESLIRNKPADPTLGR